MQMALAAVWGVGLLLPTAADRASAAERVEAMPAKTAAQRPLQDRLPPTVGVRHDPNAVLGAEVGPSEVGDAIASGPGPISAEVLRALLSDPAIRTFVGTAENAWDFTAPESIPGFGRTP